MPSHYPSVLIILKLIKVTDAENLIPRSPSAEYAQLQLHPTQALFDPSVANITGTCSQSSKTKVQTSLLQDSKIPIFQIKQWHICGQIVSNFNNLITNANTKKSIEKLLIDRAEPGDAVVSNNSIGWNFKDCKVLSISHESEFRTPVIKNKSSFSKLQVLEIFVTRRAKAAQLRVSRTNANNGSSTRIWTKFL